MEPGDQDALGQGPPPAASMLHFKDALRPPVFLIWPLEWHSMHLRRRAC